MKKKILALLTTLAMLISVTPAVFAEGETTEDTTTYLDAYTTIATSNYSSIDGSIADKCDKSEGLEMKTGNAYFNVNFGEVAPIGIIIKSGYGRYFITGRMYIEVENGTDNYTTIGYIDPYVKGGHIAAWGQNRYLMLNDTAKTVCQGNKSVRFRLASGTFGNFHEFRFFDEEADVAGIMPAYAPAYESLKGNLCLNEGVTVNSMSHYTVGTAFGDTAAQNLMFEITRTSAEAATLPSVNVMPNSSTVAATVPSITVDAGETVTQYAVVSNPENFVGNMPVYLRFSERLKTNASNGTGSEQDAISKTMDFKFINGAPKSPYAEVLAEPFKGEANVGIVDFGELGAKSVSVVYDGTGDLSINGEVVATLEAGSNNATINLDMAKFKGIQNVTLSAVEGLSVSSVIFNEMTFENPFDKDEINAVYIGAAVTAEADWTLAIEEKLAANSTAYYGTTFTNTDVVVPSTDAGKLDLVKSVTNGDIIFIQTSDIAESLVKAYAELSTVPYVIVVGEAAYADTYGIKTITADGEGLGATETYAKPVVTAVVAKDPYAGISTNKNTYDSKTMPDGPQDTGFIAGFTTSYTKGLGYEYKNYDFSKSVGSVKVEYSPKTGSGVGAKLDIKIDSYDGPTVATFVRPEGGEGWVTLETPTLVPVTGVHNIYIVYGGDSGTWSAFGNVRKVQFVAADSINEMTTAVATAATEVEGNIYLDASTTASFGNMSDVTKLASLPATIAATGNGTIYVKSADATLATISLENPSGNFAKVVGEIAEDVAAATDLTLVYEGEGHCYIKNINLATLDIMNATFDASNYSEKAASVSISDAGQIYALTCTPDHQGKYIAWSNVDFGDVQKALDLSASIGYPRTGTGEALSIYIDEISEDNKFVELVTSSEGSEWGNGKFTRTAPLTSYPTGIHDIYVRVDNSNAPNSNQDNRFINLYSFAFDEAASTDTIRIVEQDIKANVIANSTETKYLRGKNTVITFMDSADMPDSYMIVAALYDVGGKLIDIDIAAKTTVDGLNGASVEIGFEGLADGNYTYKYFFWDGATLKPLANNSTTVVLPTTF